MHSNIPWVIVLCLVGCAARDTGTEQLDQPVAMSLTGQPFYEPQRSPEQQTRLDSLVGIARTNFENDPSEENYIWYGRREGYLMHLREAVAIFTEGLEKY